MVPVSPGVEKGSTGTGEGQEDPESWQGWAGLGCSAGAVAALDSPVESVPCPVRIEPVARGSLCLR